MALKTITLEVDGSTRHARKSARAFHDGWEHQKQRRWREAIGCYDRALAIDRNLFGALANRGMCWHQLGNPNMALFDYARAMRIGTPDLCRIIRVNRGVLYASVRRYDEALADFAADDSQESRLNASYIHLLRGNTEHGLALYRSRPTVTGLKAPLRTLDDLAGKKVLIVHEQGFGDSIMMARFVPQIAAVAKSVHWTTRTALMPLLHANLWNVTFSDGGDVKAAALRYEHDEFVLVMDLWQTCGLKIDGRPYLSQSIAETHAQGRGWGLPRNRRLIGLSWRGRTEFANDHNRSMALKDLMLFLSTERNATFVSLQKDLRDDERISGMIDGGALINDFADSAALISCLDAVVSVDTATAHLAGALGVKTAILLPYAPDWRWGGDAPTTPWYDSVRLFRQPDFGAWAPAVSAASAWVRCD